MRMMVPLFFPVRDGKRLFGKALLEYYKSGL
jgi:hypothetical protein